MGASQVSRTRPNFLGLHSLCETSTSFITQDDPRTACRDPRRITSCPRFSAPVAFRRFHRWLRSRCAVAVFLWWCSTWWITMTAGCKSGSSPSSAVQRQPSAAAFHAPRAAPIWARLVNTQCTCSFGFSRVLSVTVCPCFKCDRSLVALAVVSNHGYPSKKAHLFHADIQCVQAPLLRLAIRSRCGIVVSIV